MRCVNYTKYVFPIFEFYFSKSLAIGNLGLELSSIKKQRKLNKCVDVIDITLIQRNKSPLNNSSALRKKTLSLFCDKMQTFFLILPTLVTLHCNNRKTETGIGSLLVKCSSKWLKYDMYKCRSNLFSATFQ